jgi:hypothetical protein
VVNTIHEARRAGLEDDGEVWSLMVSSELAEGSREAAEVGHRVR